ncbi:MAG: altronate dehydratase family protein [Spirochaetaceae bacterium]|nr:altronate dehydratase family protein [Spirochaetaceae bacterium]
MQDCILINHADNVAVALKNLASGSEISVGNHKVTLKEEIPAGHKIALQDFKTGDNIVKYGNPIGHAIKDIPIGSHVHTHNIKTNLSGLSSYSFEQNLAAISFGKNHAERKILAYPRKNGEVGIRNELWIVPLVGCVNGVANAAVKAFEKNYDTGHIDYINVLAHPYGCSQLGIDHENTKAILQNLVKHPNAGGVLVFGLGCENNLMADFKATLGDYDESRTRFLVAQEVDDEQAEIVKLLTQLADGMKGDKRQEFPISKLKIGLKCGGSDGFSGITANPLVGLFSDYLVNLGGTSILAEVPEMFGAEKLLMARSIDKEVFAKNVAMINDFKQYFIDNKQEIYENPSPGNKEGGITTLEDKSLGCTQKAGVATVVDVLKYTERVKKNGLNLFNTPGNDLVASSGMAAAGAHLVLFTTGRGNPYGTVVPTVKIATNSTIAGRKPHWFDFNAGVILESGEVESALESFIDVVTAIASGQKAKNELAGMQELAIFKSGVTL